MTAPVTHVFPNASLAIAEGTIDLATSLSVLLIDASSVPYTWNSTSQAHTFVSNVLNGSGAGVLTEVSTVGTNYTRQALTGISGSVSGLTMEISANSPQWNTATFTAAYAFFYESVHSTDSTRRVICYWDFSGSIQPVGNAEFLIELPGGILIEAPST